MSTQLLVVGLGRIGEVRAGDDLAAVLLSALRAGGDDLTDGDVLVVASKIVSKAEGRQLAAGSRDAAIEAETVRVVAERTTPRGVARIVQSRAGPVMAAAGVDTSNVAPGTVLLLPVDPDASAAALRARLGELSGVRKLGVLLSDTAGRPWREGLTDFALGAAGVVVTEDLRGGSDGYGNRLEVTVRAVADQLAAAADLVKGKLDGVPAALVRGAGDLLDDAAPGAASLLRAPEADWFRLGHVEAVHSALGVPPGSGGPPPQPQPAAPVPQRLARAVRVAVHAPDPLLGAAVGCTVVPDGDGVRVCTEAGMPALGALAQRVAAAAWAEGVAVQLGIDGDPPALRVAALPGR